ncbi:MAG: monovalent cation:proton antiporter-2 (CPA2) family protein [Bacteriovoracaceae bacterium]
MTTYIDQTLVFIGSALLMVPIFHRLGFGSVLGYLIAGVLVGPFGFGLIHEAESVLHFAELGVVLLLFIIGLEIQPQKLWEMRRKLIGLGGLQVLFCGVAFTLISFAFGFSWITSLVLGLGLSLSSTAFAIQTLTERNQFNTEFGRSSFSVLLMQDLIAIPALAIIPLLGQSKTSQIPSLLSVVSLLLILGALVVSSRILIRPLFRIIAATRTREIFTAATLFIVLGVATLMEKIGLSAALGTFVAGVLLADSEYRHELEANLEPFKNLLMGLFFIAVGMGVSLELIVQKPLIILGLAIGYMSLKFAIIYGVGRMNQLSHENAKLMALNISQGGEFAFVIFGIAYATGLVPQETILMMTAVISISMIFSPILNIMNDQINARLCKDQAKPQYDVISNESPDVIIAGLGRVGQIFARALRAQAIPFVAIDHDSEQIEMLRKFGNKVYYGDASRVEILEAAGAGKAKYLILVIDDVEASLRTVEIVQEHFPKLKIFARARNRGHVFDLMEMGVTHIKRETFDSSVSFVKDLLIEMGHTKERAAEVIDRFRRHDEVMVKEQFKVRKDDKMFVSVSKQANAQLADVLNNETYQSYLDNGVN